MKAHPYKTSNNWQRPAYLLDQALKESGSHLLALSDPANMKLPWLKELSENIVHSGKYELVAAYYQHYHHHQLLRLNEQEGQGQGTTSQDQRVLVALLSLYSLISKAQGKFLIGTALPDHPLWLNPPSVTSPAASAALPLNGTNPAALAALTGRTPGFNAGAGSASATPTPKNRTNAVEQFLGLSVLYFLAHLPYFGGSIGGGGASAGNGKGSTMSAATSAYREKQNQAQAGYDRLLFPDFDQWPAIMSEWDAPAITRFSESIARRLRLNNTAGNAGGESSAQGGSNISTMAAGDGAEAGTEVISVDKEAYLHLLRRAYLDRRYKLVEGYPVVVRFAGGDPFLNQLYLMQKQNRLFCRLEVRGRCDLLHSLNLEDGSSTGLLDNLRLKDLTPATTASASYAVASLIASVYYDLVTAEEVGPDQIRYHNRSHTNPTTDRTTRVGKGGGNKENSATNLSWKYLPRRIYLARQKQLESTNPALEGVATQQAVLPRQNLDEQEQQHQQAAHKYAQVVGHIRRYPNKPQWQASQERQALAHSAGIALGPGETYVEPYTRGGNLADTLADAGVDINHIPHYVKRKVLLS